MVVFLRLPEVVDGLAGSFCCDFRLLRLELGALEECVADVSDLPACEAGIPIRYKMGGGVGPDVISSALDASQFGG